MFNRKDKKRDAFMLEGKFGEQGYDWWWHSFTGHDAETGEERAFFVEFYTCNPDLGGEQPVFGQLSENQEKGIKPSYLMVKAGCWGEEHMQLHRFFGWDDVRISYTTPIRITAGGCSLSEEHTKGRIKVSAQLAADHPEYMSDAGEIEWDLVIDKKISFNVGYGAGSLLRKMQAFEMYWHAQGMKSNYRGIVKVNGRQFIVDPETSYGYADKNWGSNFTSPWVLLSSCNLTSLDGASKTRKLENSVFDIGGGCPKVFGIALKRKLLSAFYYEGQQFEFNFSKFWTGTKTKFTSKETPEYIYWHVRQENRTAVMDTKVRCRKKDMLLINYEAPDGTKRHNRLWNGGNGVGIVELYRKDHGELVLIDRIKAENVGCEYGEFTE